MGSRAPPSPPWACGFGARAGYGLRTVPGPSEPIPPSLSRRLSGPLGIIEKKVTRGGNDSPVIPVSIHVTETRTARRRLAAAHSEVSYRERSKSYNRRRYHRANRRAARAEIAEALAE